MKYRQFKKTIAILLTCVIAMGAVTIPVGATVTIHPANRIVAPGSVIVSSIFTVYGGDTIDFNISWAAVGGTVQIGYVRDNVYRCVVLAGGSYSSTWKIDDGADIQIRIVNLSNLHLRITGTYAHKNNLSTRSARVLYDSTVTKSALNYFTDFVFATNSIRKKFGIDFSLTGLPTQSSALNGGNCTLPLIEHCDEDAVPSCGADTSCDSTHLRGASRLNALLRLSDTYTVRVVGHKLCRYNTTNGHYKVDGTGSAIGRDCVVSGLTSRNLSSTIQHELSHNIGGIHVHCDDVTPNQRCVMKVSSNLRTINEWCTSCTAEIRNNKN